MRAGSTRFIPVMVVLALAASTTIGSAAEGAPSMSSQRAATSGYVLTGKGLFDASGAQNRLDFGFRAMGFAPDGAAIVGFDDGADQVVVQHSDGSQQRLPVTWPGPTNRLTWSPDGTRLAVETASAIYSYSLATTSSTLVVASTPELTLNLGPGGGNVSWSPDSSRLAFIGSAGNDSAAQQQVYVVAAGGGVPTAYASPPQTGSQQWRFTAPDWSPDGTRIAAWVDENGYDGTAPYRKTFVGLLTAGSAGPPVLVREGTGAGGPIWSAEGGRLLVGLYQPGQPDATPPVPTIIAAPGGEAVGTVSKGTQFVDWQPCPTGTCAAFRDRPVERTIVFKTSTKAAVRGKKVVFHGNLRSSTLRCTQGQVLKLERAVRKKHFSVMKKLNTGTKANFVLERRVTKTALYRVVAEATPDCLAAVSATIKVKVRKKKGGR
jgi:hypothetical protein